MPLRLPATDRLAELFDYDPESGQLRWRYRFDVPCEWNTKYAGELAGNRRKDGYLLVAIDGVRYLAHRIIWKLMTGEEPLVVDHRDVEPQNNRFINLRAASRSQSQGNKRKYRTNTSGYKGVSPLHDFPGYMARIYQRGRHRYLGVFPTPEEAHAAYVRAAEEQFGEFARAA